MHVYICMYAYKCINAYTSFIYIHIYIYIYIYMCVCVCVGDDSYQLIIKDDHQ